MTVYYHDDLITLHLGDALEVTDWLAGDVLITDPPYAVDASGWGQKHGRVHEAQDWDADLIVRDRVLEMWGDRPYAMFGSPRRIDAAPPHREVPLVWDKGDVVAMGDTSFPWRPTYELIYVNGKGWNGYRGQSVIRSRHSSSNARDLGHPTPKPVPLMEELVRKAPAGIIVDTFAGTGATLIAARNLGRRSIGVEVSESYAEAAVRRILGEPPHLFGDV